MDDVMKKKERSVLPKNKVRERRDKKTEMKEKGE